MAQRRSMLFLQIDRPAILAEGSVERPQAPWPNARTADDAILETLEASHALAFGARSAGVVPKLPSAAFGVSRVLKLDRAL